MGSIAISLFQLDLARIFILISRFYTLFCFRHSVVDMEDAEKYAGKKRAIYPMRSEASTSDPMEIIDLSDDEQQNEQESLQASMQFHCEDQQASTSTLMSANVSNGHRYANRGASNAIKSSDVRWSPSVLLHRVRIKHSLANQQSSNDGNVLGEYHSFIYPARIYLREASNTFMSVISTEVNDLSLENGSNRNGNAPRETTCVNDPTNIAFVDDAPLEASGHEDSNHGNGPSTGVSTTIFIRFSVFVTEY